MAVGGGGERGQEFQAIDDEELDWLVRAGECVLGELGRLVIAAVIGCNNEAAALALLNYGKGGGRKYILDVY